MKWVYRRAGGVHCVSIKTPIWNLLRSQQLPRIEQNEHGRNVCVRQNTAPLSGFHLCVQRQDFVVSLLAVLLMGKEVDS